VRLLGREAVEDAGEVIEPTSSRMRWMRVLPMMASENDQRTVAGYGRGK
jgi:hypothetical protein